LCGQSWRGHPLCPPPPPPPPSCSLRYRIRSDISLFSSPLLYWRVRILFSRALPRHLTAAGLSFHPRPGRAAKTVRHLPRASFRPPRSPFPMSPNSPGTHVESFSLFSSLRITRELRPVRIQVVFGRSIPYDERACLIVHWFPTRLHGHGPASERHRYFDGSLLEGYLPFSYHPDPRQRWPRPQRDLSTTVLLAPPSYVCQLADPVRLLREQYPPSDQKGCPGEFSAAPVLLLKGS